MRMLLLAVLLFSALKAVAAPAQEQKEDENTAGPQPALHNPSLPAAEPAISAGFLLEPAYYAVASILLYHGDFAGCIRAADEGLAHVPQSARLHLSKAAAQEGLHRWYDARRTLETGARISQDPDLLRRHAETEEQYGQTAGPAYRKAVVACVKADEPRRDCLALTQRGLTVSVRDGDKDSAEWFAGRLRSSGRRGPAAIADVKPIHTPEIRVPGGIAAILGLVAEGYQISKDDFLNSFARIVSLPSSGPTGQETLCKIVERHFEIIGELEGLGRLVGDRIQIELSLTDSSARERTQKVLGILGWEFAGNSRIRPAQGTSAAKRQQTSASLSLDEVAMQEDLASQKRYVMEIGDDWVPITAGEALWRDQFYAKQHFAGGFTQALAGDPRLARLYAGISELDEETSGQIIQAFGIGVLYQNFSDLLFRHSADLAVRDGRVAVPGGSKADPAWESITGANPSNVGQFLGKLFRKDDGKLMAFFSSLMQLDKVHQAFFTSSAARLAQFYGFFKSSPGLDTNVAFKDFISQIPLDSEGHVRFPGSPEVWVVLGSGAGSVQRAEEVAKRGGRPAAPETEEAILSRLARVGYLSHFVGVVQVEAHRSERLDEASVLLLARQYPGHREIWPYLTALTGLKLREYTQLFQLQSRLQSLDLPTRNDVAGEFHSIAKLLCLAQQFGRIEEKKAASIFGAYCARLTTAGQTSDFAVAALHAIRELIESGGMPAENPDLAVRDLLLTSGEERERRNGYQEILEYQKVPTLASLFGVQTAAANLGSGTGDLAAYSKQLQESLAALLELDLHGSWTSEDNQSFSNPGAERLRSCAREFAKASSRKNPDRNQLTNLGTELMRELNPQIRVALTGILYAFYFRPTDLLIAEDPAFLRRHQFVRLIASGTNCIDEPAYLSRNKEGSYLVGGFGNFGFTSSLVSMATSRKVQEAAKPFAAAVLGSIRDTNWRALGDDDLRVVGLRVRAAREWIVRSSGDPGAMNALADSSIGLLSASRGAKLLRAVSLSQWDLAWSLLDRSELFFLGEQLAFQSGNESVNSPTIAALVKISALADPSSLHWLGPGLTSILGCGRPHLLRLPPHENFEKYMLPNRLAERSNEFKLYLAELFDRSGTPAAALEPGAEALAVRLFSGVRMQGAKDWRSVLTSYSGMDWSWIADEASRK